MAEAVLIGVVLIEGMLMLPLVYRQLEDSVVGRALRTARILGLPAAVTGGLAWLVGRGGGPLYAFTDTHIRIVGFIGIAVAGAVLTAVFYALLLVSLPSEERQVFLNRMRGSFGRLRARLR
jgi:hypothetical protein